MDPGRFLKNLRFRLFYLLLTKPGVPLVTYGGACKWTVKDTGLGPASTVLCAGAGHDISFEKALIATYNCKVVLADPSPTGIATVRRENVSPEQLHFLPVALAGHDGSLGFSEPADPLEGSFRSEETGASSRLQFPCRSLSSLMNELGWTRLDLLKMDIEGSEYAVIRHLLRERLDVTQICVEFHHRLPFRHTRSETIRAIFALRRSGYDLVHRFNYDHTFLHR